MLWHRPLIFGKRESDEGTEWIVGSESVAITADSKLKRFDAR